MPAPRSLVAPVVVLVVALLPAAVAAAAGDRLGSAEPAPAAGAPGYGQSLPATMPRRLAGVPGAWALPGGLDGAEPDTDHRPDGGVPPTPAGTTVTITATVLPTATIVVRGGDVVGVWSNAPGADLRRVAWIVREGRVDGEPGAMTGATWHRAREVIASAPRSRAERATPGRIA